MPKVITEAECCVPMPNQLPSRVYLSGNSKQRPDVAHAEKYIFFGPVNVSSKAIHLLELDMTAFSTLHELFMRALLDLELTHSCK